MIEVEKIKLVANKILKLIRVVTITIEAILVFLYRNGTITVVIGNNIFINKPEDLLGGIIVFGIITGIVQFIITALKEEK